MTPATPPTPDAAPSPVFVDDSGRRHRFVRVVGWCLGILMLAYLALLGISLVGSPGLVPLSLPAIGRLLPGPAAPLVGGPSQGHRPGELVAPSAAPTNGTGGSSGGSVVTTPATPAPHPTSHPGVTATPRPTASATVTQRPQATPTAHGTPRATHSPSAQPTKSPHGSPRNVKASPTPTASAT